ncbi:MAG: carboxypeptidase regulatory-like domain-containing protein [Armatimonadetes bacterium]|nr:carboxypeptidase regulatory-like domain-containing protein [Armatimonadota bacterium]
MEFARVRFKATALMALAGFALAALLVGGCTTPDRDERAQFTTLSGFVRTAQGVAVPGATVAVVRPGTANYFGQETFTTDPAGRFVIEGVQVRTGSPVTLRLRANAPGFGAAFVSRAGAATPDIVVVPANLPLADLVAVLNPTSASAFVGPAGATITAPVVNPQVPGASLGTVRVEFPSGAVATTTEITVTPVIGAGLPAAISGAAAGTTAAPVSVPRVAATTTRQVRTVAMPLAAVDLQPTGLTFPAGREPTILLPLPVTLPVGTVLPVMRYNPNNGLWEFETNATVVNVGGGLFAQFRVSRFSTRYVGVTAVWTIEASGNAVAAELFPPTNQFPIGYTPIAPVLTNSLAFPAVTDPNAQSTLFADYEGIRPTDAPANGNAKVGFVPAPERNTGIQCRRFVFGVTVDSPQLGLVGLTGTRSSWDCQEVTAQPVQQLPPHIQGHVQGG